MYFSLMFSYIKFIANNIFIFFIRVFLYLIKKLQNFFNYIYKSISSFKINFYSQKKYIIKSKSEMNNYIIFRENGKIETLYFPQIHKLTLGGEIKVLTKGIEIYEFQNVSYSMNSDFIRFENQTSFCDKVNRIESSFSKFGDSDFLKQKDGYFNLLSYTKSINFDFVFHMTGCFSKVWTHFLVQYYPKLNYLNLISKDDVITIVLPIDVDSHIYMLIKQFIKDLQNIKVVIVPNDTLVTCKKLVYVSNDTWLGDVGISATLFHIQISDSTVNFILNQANKLLESLQIIPEIKIKKTKLFIGRKGKRNINNYSEVLEYFQNLGFVEIFPHLLSFEEKLILFSNAEYVTGPFSSGFANIIFCRKKPVVFPLINLSRHDDLFLTKFTKSLDINYLTFLGHEKSPGYSDSDYYIDLVELNNVFSTL
jgi:hypothetical protein